MFHWHIMVLKGAMIHKTKIQGIEAAIRMPPNVLVSIFKWEENKKTPLQTSSAVQY